MTVCSVIANATFTPHYRHLHVNGMKPEQYPSVVRRLDGITNYLFEMEMEYVNLFMSTDI